MSLDKDDPLDADQASTRQDQEDEYSRLLTHLKVEELRIAARRWGVRLRKTRKASIVRQLATWLSDPSVIRAQIDKLDDLGLEVLTYLHLVLAPDYGMTADSIVHGAVQHQERARQGAEATDLPLTDTPLIRGSLLEHGEAIQERIAQLTQQGLLLPFRQSGFDYYVLPAAVRPCLPPRAKLSIATKQTDSLTVHEATIGQRVQALYAVWTAIAGGIPGTGQPLSRQAYPLRQQIENSWAALRDWNNDPDEIADIEAGRFGHSRSGAPRLSRYSSSTLNWTLTVCPPPRRLSDKDLAFVREQTGRPAPEIEFCYVLLEALGALSGAPGQPASIHREAMHRFLRASPTAKVHALWQAWTTNEAWSEMESVLRSTRQGTPHVRLRRSLAQPDFKPANLYSEWKDARQTVLRFLSLLDEDRWVPVDGFLRVLYSVHPDLLHNLTDSSIWRLESPKTGKQFGATIEDWQQGHGRFVIEILKGPLYWLGLVRLGYSSAASPTPDAFQLTPAGALALGRRTTLLDPSRTKRATAIAAATATKATEGTVFAVSDDLTITLLPGHAPVELYDLVHAVGALIEATPDRFVYRLNASRVLSWAETVSSQNNASTSINDAVETLIAALSKHSTASGAQPQVASSWQHKLRTWGRNYGQLHVYENLTLLELADDYALQELLVSTSLGEHVVYPFSPHLVAIRDDAIDTLVQEMETRGYTPRVK